MAKAFSERACGRVRSPGVLPLLAALALLDCEGDHDALLRRPGVSGSSGMGGAGSGGSGGKAGSTSSSGTGGSSAASGGSGGMKVVEPQGRSVVTLVHGVVDAERIAWCFARGTGDDANFVGQPEPPGGLSYGEAFPFETLDGVDLEDDEVSLHVLTGELELVSGLDCDEAVERAREAMAVAGAGSGAGGASGGQGGAAGETGAAAGASGLAGAGGEAGDDEGAGGQGGASSAAGGAADTAGDGGASGSGEPDLPPPPRLRAASLAGFAPGALSDGYSLLLVAAGCIGGPAFSDAREKEICGEDYAPRQGNLTAELVVLSRKTSSLALALQALHASRASGERGIRVVPPPDAVLSTVTIADALGEGTLRPREPRVDLGRDDWGLDGGDWSVQVNDNGTPVFDESWPAILGRGGLDELELARGYTVVLIGPSSELRARSWWNGPAMTIVDNDPEAD